MICQNLPERSSNIGAHCDLPCDVASKKHMRVANFFELLRSQFLLDVRNLLYSSIFD